MQSSVTELTELAMDVLIWPLLRLILQTQVIMGRLRPWDAIHEMHSSPQSGGFFLECGGLDGERSSNTPWLEQKKDWNRVLIEMDPSYYMQLRGKNRKCYSVNACLCPKNHPDTVILSYGTHKSVQLKCSQLVNKVAPKYDRPLFLFFLVWNAVGFQQIFGEEFPCVT